MSKISSSNRSTGFSSTGLRSSHPDGFGVAKKISTTVYLTEEQRTLLKALNERSKVPIAEYIRQGIDLVLEKHCDILPGQMELKPLPLGQGEDSSSNTK